MKDDLSHITEWLNYRRKSEEDEGRQAASLESQEEWRGKVCKEKGISISRTFEESASAFRTKNRPEFKKMMEYIQERKNVGILVWHLNRLSRNPRESGIIQQAIRDGNIGAVLTNDGLYSCYGKNSIMLYVKFGLAEQYSLDLSEDVKRGLMKRVIKLDSGEVRQGGALWNHWAPEGYLNDRNTQTVIVDPLRGPAITKAFERVASGESIAYVAKSMNTFRTRKGNLLTTSTLHGIIRNPFYRGAVVRKGIEYPGAHEPLVDADVWLRANKIKKPIKTVDCFFPFRHKVKWAKTGTFLTSEIKKGKYVYYRPSDTAKRGPYIREDKLDQLIAGVIERYQPTKELIKMLKERLLLQQEDTDNTRIDERQKIERAIQMCTARKKNLLMKLADEVINSEDYKDACKGLDAEILTHEAELIKINRRSRKDFGTVAKVLELLENLYQTYKRQPLNSKAVLLEMLQLNFIYDNGVLAVESAEPVLVDIKKCNELRAGRASWKEIELLVDRIFEALFDLPVQLASLILPQAAVL